jgi:hypothetical protein
MILCAFIAVGVGQFPTDIGWQYSFLSVPLTAIAGWASNHKAASGTINEVGIYKEQKSQIEYHILTCIDSHTPDEILSFDRIYSYVVEKPQRAHDNAEQYTLKFNIKTLATGRWITNLIRHNPSFEELENSLDIFDVNERKVRVVLEEMLEAEKLRLETTNGIIVYKRFRS